MKKGVWFLFIFLGIFFIPKFVFARVERVMTLPSDYGQVLTNVTISQGNNSVDYTGWTNSTAFIRLYSDDTLEPNKTYVSSFGFCVYTWDKDNTAIFGNAIGGWNVSGGYVSTSPVTSSVVDYNVTTIAGRDRFQRCYSQSWEFTTPSSISSPFFQIGLSPNNQTLAKFTWWNWSIIQKDSSASDITNSISNNTTTIINNFNETTENIINNNNQNAQDIMNNQNEIAQQQEENQKVCFTKLITKKDVVLTGKYLYTNGQLNNGDDWGITDYIVTNVSLKKTVQNTNAYASVCFYRQDKSLISCSSNFSLPFGIIVLPTDTYYSRFSINLSTNTPQFESNYCKNGNQAISDNMNDMMNDDLSEFSESGGGAGRYFDSINTTSETPVSDLILFPLNFLNKLYDEMSTSCSSYTFNFNLWGNNNYQLTLPCINLEAYLGSNLWTTIDYLCCFGMIYNIAMLIISFFESWTSLQDTFDSLYTPRHVNTGDYFPKHGG